MRKPLTRLTLRQMQLFLAVCDHRSYSRAAEAMALTQPAISLQMRQLEDMVGQPLFEYLGRKLHLTEAAEVLQRACLDVLDRLENLDMRLSDLRGSLQGQLRLAVESSAQYFVPHLFAAFRERHPEVSLQLAVVSHAQALKRVVVHRDDLLIMTMVPGDMGLEFLPFLENPIIAVARPDHPLATRESLALQELTVYPLLLREQGSATRTVAEEYCHQKRAHFSQTLEIGSLEAQLEGVIAGLGLAMLPRHAVRRELASGELIELPVAELPLRRSWCVVHPRDKQLSPVAQAFFDFVRRERGWIKSLAERFQYRAQS